VYTITGIFSNIMKTEKVFEILGEGGGISIYRQKTKTEEKFLYHHSEFDPTDEGLEVNEKSVYPSFEEPFQLINNKYPWYKLHIASVHSDYRDYVADRLIDKLNEKSIDPDYLGYRKMDLEDALNIELRCEIVDNKPIWSYSKTEK